MIGFITGLGVGLFLTVIGVMFVYLAMQTRPQQALGMYAVGMFIKMVIGISSCIAVALLTNISMIPFMLTLGTIVCISYPATAIVLTNKMKVQTIGERS